MSDNRSSKERCTHPPSVTGLRGYDCPFCTIARLERDVANGIDAQNELHEQIYQYQQRVRALERQLKLTELVEQRYAAALRKIADGDPAQVRSPIGALHAAGMVTQWEMDAKIAREALVDLASPEMEELLQQPHETVATQQET